MPISSASAPASRMATASSTYSARSGKPPVKYGISIARSSARALRERFVERIARAGSLARDSMMSCTWFTSLSPRPERLTRIVPPWAASSARRQAYAMAWADSSAGMMPSERDVSANACNASASSTET